MEELVNEIDEVILNFNEISYSNGLYSMDGNLVTLVNKIDSLLFQINLIEQINMDDRSYIPKEYPEKHYIKLINRLKNIEISEIDKKRLKIALGRKYPGLQLSTDYLTW